MPAFPIALGATALASGLSGGGGSLSDALRMLLGSGAGQPLFRGQIQQRKADAAIDNILGGATPNDILRTQGQVSPQPLLSLQNQARRGAEASSRQTEADLARFGMLGSASGQALLGAQRQSGESLASQLGFQWQQAAEDRLRQDLLNFLINPQLTREGIQAGVSIQQQALDQQQQNNLIGLLGTLLIGGGQFFG